MQAQQQVELQQRPRMQRKLSDMSQNAKHQTSTNDLNLPSPVLEHEHIEEVTETGLNTADKQVSSQPEVYFHMKSMVKSSKQIVISFSDRFLCLFKTSLHLLCTFWRKD